MKIRDVILSIKPKYWDLIKSGVKTVEWRRKWVKDDTIIGQVYFYVSAPVQKIMGIGYIDWVVDRPWALWDQYGSKGGISKEQFDAYMPQNGSSAYALYIRRLHILDVNPIIPADHWPWWKSPPQNFMYVREE